MCDPISLVLGAVGAASVAGAEKQRKAASQAATQQREMMAAQAAANDPARAAAEAAQDANARLAATQQRRRAQTLMSRGQTPGADSPLASTEPVTRATPGRQQTLMARGNPATFL
jgi:hypothetical protein